MFFFNPYFVYFCKQIYLKICFGKQKVKKNRTLNRGGVDTQMFFFSSLFFGSLPGVL